MCMQHSASIEGRYGKGNTMCPCMGGCALEAAALPHPLHGEQGMASSPRQEKPWMGDILGGETLGGRNPGQ